MPRPSQDPEFTDASTVDGEGRRSLELHDLAHEHEDTISPLRSWVVVNDVDGRGGSGISQKTVLCDGLQRVENFFVPLFRRRKLIRYDPKVIRVILIEPIHHIVSRHVHTVHRSVPLN